MQTATLKKVGNSKAFIVPAKILRKHNVGEDGYVYYEEKDDQIIIRFKKENRPPSLFAKKLRTIAQLPGPKMTMDDVRSDRTNKEEVQ